MSSLHVVFSGGGTGGHLFPGLAVAERLTARAPGLRITFCGTGKPSERTWVESAGFDYFTLSARPMPRGPREAVAFVVENLTSYLAAGQFLRDQRVSAVVGLGGYASAPMARAAARRRVPLVLLEQNAVAGKATRWLARHAALICTSFKETVGLKTDRPIRVTGNPVRSMGGFHRRRSTLHGSLSTLLVLGGSGGARALNQNVPRALHKVRSQLTGWRIVHQSGHAELEATRTLYRKLDLPAQVVPFLGDVPRLLASTDLAICRAGGTTLAELATAGVPALLLPYPLAADDHQVANARHYTAGGGCITIDQRTVLGRLDDELADALCFLLANDELRRSMAAAMRRLARPRAADEVAELLWSVVSSRSVVATAADAVG
ncbi:MAG: undecaprenyldiphospho-muramoylpentapeptide beta-N-acetylglucosaminyltransferase [Planctomycetaceae bacterium]|nr:undecaprenyldiphospho-muramoylpentapeptide beta-N-acetylglucosaminyltransferase [Planctomycetaceae bacterium]